MHVTVDIGGKISYFDFDKSNISIGSSPKNDISLDYQGIGDLHLKIQLIGDIFQVIDLNSGSYTFVDEKHLAPGETAILNASSEIEIGGIYIKVSQERSFKKDFFQFETDSQLEIEDDSSQSIDNLLKGASGAIPNAEELRKIEEEIAAVKASTIYEESEDENRYKTDLFSSPLATPTKLVKNESSKRQKRKIPKLRASRKINPRGGRKVSNTSRYLVVLLLLGFGFLTYEYYLKEKLFLEVNLASNKNKSLSPNLPSSFTKHKDLFNSYTVRENCNSNSSQPTCTALSSLIPEDKWGATVVGSTLVIGFDERNVDRLTNSLFEPKKVNEEELREVIQAQYSDYFDFKAFRENGYLPPLKNYTYKKDENRNLYFLVGLLLNGFIKPTDNVDNIFVFVYADFSSEIMPLEFMFLTTKALEREIKLFESTMARLKLGWWFDLTEDFDQIIAGIGASTKISFDETLARQSSILATRKIIKARLLEDKCSGSIAQFVCSSISSQRERAPYEGANLIHDGIAIFYNLDLIEESYQDLSFEPYTNEDKRNLLIALAHKTIKERKTFQANNYIDEDSDVEWLPEILLAEFFLSNYVDNILSEENIENITIVGVRQNNQTPSVDVTVKAPLSSFKKINRLTLRSRLPYLVKSKVSLFSEILRNKLMPTEF